MGAAADWFGDRKVGSLSEASVMLFSKMTESARRTVKARIRALAIRRSAVPFGSGAFADKTGGATAKPDDDLQEPAER
jgi:hypothetical protein